MKLALVGCVPGLEPRLVVELGDQLLDVAAAGRWLNLPYEVPSTIKRLAQLGRDGLERVHEIVTAVERAGLGRTADIGLLLDKTSVTFFPPVPNPSKFLAVGKNYRAHLEELQLHGMIKEMPDEPTGFIKLNSALSGHDAAVRRPDGITTFDYEPELAFVIGRRAVEVERDDALDYVLGITAFNDLTAREIQKREVESGTRFWTAKNMPGFGPLGPFVVTLDEINDLSNLWLSCSVNGEQRLRFTTKDQIHRIPDIIAHFSRYIPLEAGDVMATGCQKGTAFAQPNAAELFLKPGDVVEAEIEGVMSLRTHIV